MFTKLTVTTLLVCAVTLSPAWATHQDSPLKTGAFVPGQTAELLQEYEDLVGGDQSVLLMYSSWGSPFPAAKVAAAVDRGVTPLITWEPWECSLSEIVVGICDSVIRSFAVGARAVPGEIFLRPMHEMNGNWYPWGVNRGSNTPDKYIAAYRRIVHIFREEGADNMRFVWSPNCNGPPRYDASTIPQYFPGDEFIDYVAISGYNWGNGYYWSGADAWSKWLGFDQVFRDPILTIAGITARPILIGEMASAETGGDKAEWIHDAFEQIKNEYPQVVGFNWFNVDKEVDWRVNSSPESLEAFRFEIEDLSNWNRPVSHMTIDAGQDLTSTNSVTIDLFATGGTEPYSMRLSNDGIFQDDSIDLGEAWVPYQARYSWNIPVGDGRKAVFVQLMDSEGKLSRIETDTITLDSIPPRPSPSVGIELPTGSVAALLEYENDVLIDHDYFVMKASATGIDADQVNQVIGLGVTPIVNWQPWGLSLDALIDSDYDALLHDLGDDLASANGRVLFLPFKEMNGNWFPWGTGADPGNSPDKLIEAYRYVVDTIRARGADNVEFVWSPHHIGLPTWTGNGVGLYYPGDPWVDFAGISGVNWGSSRAWSSWKSFSALYSRAYSQVKAVSTRPILLTGVASSEQGGNKAQWIKEMFELLPTQYPRVQGLIWSNESGDDWELTSSTEAVKAFRTATDPIQINTGSTLTNNIDVTLDIAAWDYGSGTSEMRVTSIGEIGQWRALSSRIPWSLPSTDGPKEISVEFRDLAGNESVKFTDSITLDTQSPITSLAIDSRTSGSLNGWYSSTPDISLSSSELGRIEYQWNGTDDEWQSYSQPISAPKGLNTLFFRSTDQVGNTEYEQSHSIGLDTISPTNPTISSSSHSVGLQTSENSIDISLLGAVDDSSGVKGFSYSFTKGSTDLPDSIQDASKVVGSVTSPGLADGNWYFHLKTEDNAGNWSSPVHLGPFIISTSPVLTLWARSNSVPFGDWAKVAGFVRDFEGFPLAGKVDLQVKNGTAWESLTTLEADSTGYFQYWFKAESSHVDYRAVLESDGTRSNLTKVNLEDNIIVWNNYRPQVRYCQWTKLHGKFGGPGGPRDGTTLYLQRWNGSGWVWEATVGTSSNGYYAAWTPVCRTTKFRMATRGSVVTSSIATKKGSSIAAWKNSKVHAVLRDGYGDGVARTLFLQEWNGTSWTWQATCRTSLDGYCNFGSKMPPGTLRVATWGSGIASGRLR